MSTKFCKSCGKGIKDLDTHPWATLCATCRAKRNPLRLVEMYGWKVTTYLDEHGWPQYAHGDDLLERYPDILVGFDIPTVRRKYTILSVCLRHITGKNGEHYKPYYQTPSGHIRRFVLVDTPKEQMAIEEVTA